jgi:hypothetical protein
LEEPAPGDDYAVVVHTVIAVVTDHHSVPDPGRERDGSCREGTLNHIHLGRSVDTLERETETERKRVRWRERERDRSF